MRKVSVAPIPLERLEQLIGPDRQQALADRSSAVRELLAGRTVWNVNSTEAGGGVAEMLKQLIGYAKTAQVNSEWLVTTGEPRFFEITKRIHNGLHGSPGDGGPLGAEEQTDYARMLELNAAALADFVKPGDVVVLHDPQTAGLTSAAKQAGCSVVWRCHVGSDESNGMTDRAWNFLEPHLRDADAFVFSRAQYAPVWVKPDLLTVIAPSIDPFSIKNEAMRPAVAIAILEAAGIVSGEQPGVKPEYTRSDGSRSLVERTATVVREGDPPPSSARLIIQISRWDALKDMPGVLAGFTEFVAPQTSDDVHLMLVGPDVESVADDPEGQQVLHACVAKWEALAPELRRRVSLVSLPVVDGEENAAIVNALQRHASVVTQKSLMEGFGLTVAEALWKGRPVVASAVGGINDQIESAEHGLLIEDPRNLEAFGNALLDILQKPALADHLGKAAAIRVSNEFLPDRHLLQWADLILELAK